MNLGKLLGAGKSFFGGRGVVSYREDKRVYLPKFNAEKNPFEAKPTQAPKPVAGAAPEAATSMSETRAAKPRPMAVAGVPKVARSGSWVERLNPFREPEPMLPEPPKAVQAELSLQAVKVLHNDLTDADVEVVPVKSRTVASVAAARLLPTREPLEVFGERRLETA